MSVCVSVLACSYVYRKREFVYVAFVCFCVCFSLYFCSIVCAQVFVCQCNIGVFGCRYVLLITSALLCVCVWAGSKSVGC